MAFTPFTTKTCHPERSLAIRPQDEVEGPRRCVDNHGSSHLSYSEASAQPSATTRSCGVFRFVNHRSTCEAVGFATASIVEASISTTVPTPRLHLIAAKNFPQLPFPTVQLYADGRQHIMTKKTERRLTPPQNPQPCALQRPHCLHGLAIFISSDHAFRPPPQQLPPVPAAHPPA